MTDYNKPTCQGCRFWDRLTDDEERGAAADGNYRVDGDGTGRCRRFPPSTSRIELGWQSDAGDAAGMAYWPVTWDHDWCGGFTARKWAE